MGVRGIQRLGWPDNVKVALAFGQQNDDSGSCAPMRER